MATSTAQGAAAAATLSKGLDGILAGETAICNIQNDELIYRGYEVHDLVDHACFEDVAHVLLVGHKPSAAESAAFKAELVRERAVPAEVIEVVQRAARASHPMDCLRTGVSLLSHHDPDTADNSPAANLRKAKRLLAKIPTLIAAGTNARHGRGLPQPDASLGHAANLLWMLTGKKHGERAVKVFDVSLILYAEHEFNASTFTARIISSTLSDLHSAVCGGIGALKGPLHGGANEAAMAMLQEVGTFDNIRSFMDKAFATKRKIMGFGHRVYKRGDTRAGVLRKYGMEYAGNEKPEFNEWWRIADAVAKIMLDEKKIHPNVDFPCGVTYWSLGLDVPDFTPIFVASRITGWSAHIMEQMADNRLIRPLSNYVGPAKRPW